MDLEEERKISKQSAEELCSTYNLSYYETSAKTNQNIDELIEYMMKLVYDNMHGPLQ
eukprot:CAMPEP_0170557102 /NCGR_PEP_ID=MMETSP0211-20121228/19199_1 /TAXON_ID=311385 /ORGANISM="Pseudokeronopsis sp., Strain OXSARD2" /LENGTH=56 /DNA_ID=CAMNT_0010867817 /DNA_START=362 /DNA_END=532 /DNA_ORIENTATION=+